MLTNYAKGCILSTVLMRVVRYAAVAKQANAADLKSAGGNTLRVQVPPAAPTRFHSLTVELLHRKQLVMVRFRLEAPLGVSVCRSPGTP